MDEKLNEFKKIIYCNFNLNDILPCEYITLIESEIYELINENNNLITEPKYYEYIYIHLYNFFECFLEITNSFNLSILYVLKKHNLIRNYNNSYTYTSVENKDYIKYLKDIPQPEQRTEEWYKFRYEHITASNGWKAFSENERCINQLIYEKCKPYVIHNYNSLSENAMTWGHKYEPITTMIYEKIYNTKIEEFGCIPHKEYDFLAASPDGIVVGENNFGRMIEIKNVVSRVINSNPKKDYYIQTQLQMEVCDLDECDFVETKFIEYQDYNDFIKDGSINKSCDEKQKGVIIVYIKDNSHYYYDYLELDINDEMLNFHLNNLKDNENLKWYKNIFWKLETFSCVLIPRCKYWFNLSFAKIKNVWDIINEERNNGAYVQRAPKKKEIKCLIQNI